jgi:hypothetical protein
MCRTALIRRRSISTTAVTPVQLGLEPNHEAFAQIADLDGQWYLLHDKQHANDTLGAFIERTLD